MDILDLPVIESPQKSDTGIQQPGVAIITSCRGAI